MGAYDRRRTIDGKRDLATDADWFLVPRTHATADSIDHKRLHQIDGLWVKVSIAKPGSIISEPFGKRSIVRCRQRLRGAIFSTRESSSEGNGCRSGAEMEKPPTAYFHGISVHSCDPLPG